MRPGKRSRFQGPIGSIALSLGSCTLGYAVWGTKIWKVVRRGTKEWSEQRGRDWAMGRFETEMFWNDLL
jgi:hypothetical protein